MKKRSVACLLGTLVLVSTLSLPAFAKNWIQIGDGHYIDVDSIRQSSSYGAYTFDTKYLGKGAPLEVINGRKVWTIKTKSYIDCKTAYGKPFLTQHLMQMTELLYQETQFTNNG